MIEEIRILLSFIFLLAGSIVLHEIGHLLSLNYYTKKKNELRLNEKDLVINIPTDIDIKKERVIIWTGILLGLIPIITMFYLLPIYLGLFALIIYGFGCKHDLKNLEMGK